jgi:hypothetical protein
MIPVRNAHAKAMTMGATVKITRQPAIADVDKPAANADDDTRQAADKADHHGLGQKLKQHIEAARANRYTDAYLARPFGDRDQHDVHHDNAADHQRDHGNRRQQIGERVLRLIGRGDGIRHVPDVEVFLAMAVHQQGMESDLHHAHVRARLHSHDDVFEEPLSEDARRRPWCRAARPSCRDRRPVGSILCCSRRQ